MYGLCRFLSTCPYSFPFVTFSVTRVVSHLQIVKFVFGAGLFGLPYALKLLGMAGGILLFFIIGWLSYYCSAVLIRVHDVATRDLLRSLTYVELAKHCFGNNAARAVYFFMVVTSIGSLGAYLVLIGNTLHSIWPSVSNLVFSGATALVMVPFALMRSTKFLSYTSVLGNVGVVVVVVAIVYGAFANGNFKPINEYTAFRVKPFPSAFGLIGFIWACSTTVITVEKAMAKRSDFFKAFQIATHIVFISGSVFALILVAAFDQDTCDIIVLNLGEGAIAMTAKIAIVLDLGFTYPLVLAPAREIVEKSLLHDSTRFLEMKRNVIRIILVALSFCLAFFPQFNIILNIVGGWSASILCFMLPPLMLLQLRRFHLMAQDRQIEYMVGNNLLKNQGGGATGSLLALPSITESGFESDGSKHFQLPHVHRKGKMIRPTRHRPHRSRRRDDPTASFDPDTPHYIESIRRAKQGEQPDHFPISGTTTPVVSRPTSRASSRASSPVDKNAPRSRRSSLLPRRSSRAPSPVNDTEQSNNGSYKTGGKDETSGEPNYHDHHYVDLDAPEHSVSSIEEIKQRVRRTEAVTVDMRDAMQTKPKHTRGARRRSILRYRRAVKTEETCPIQALAVKHHPNVMVFHPWTGKLLGNRVQREKRALLKKTKKDREMLDRVPFEDILPSVPVIDPKGNVDVSLLNTSLLENSSQEDGTPPAKPMRRILSLIPEQAESEAAVGESVSIESEEEASESSAATPTTKPRTRRPSVTQRRASLVGHGVPARVHMRIHGHKLHLPATLSAIDVLATTRNKSKGDTSVHAPGTVSMPVSPMGERSGAPGDAPASADNASERTGFRPDVDGVDRTITTASSASVGADVPVRSATTDVNAIHLGDVHADGNVDDPVDPRPGIRLEVLSVLPEGDPSSAIPSDLDTDLNSDMEDTNGTDKKKKEEENESVDIDVDKTVVLDVEPKEKNLSTEDIALASSSFAKNADSEHNKSFYKKLESILPPAMQKNPDPIDTFLRKRTKAARGDDRPNVDIPSAAEVRHLVDKMQSKNDTLAVRDDRGRLWNNRLPHRRRLHRHQRALAILKIAGWYESIFLILVALFGFAVLIFTTVASLQDAIQGPIDPMPEICLAA